VSRFVGVVSLTSTRMTLKTDHVFSRFPARITMYRYNFAEKFWQLHQGIVRAARQAENPGNFLLDVALQPEDHEHEMIPEDPRVQEIMEKMEFFVHLEFFTRLSHNTFWAVLSRPAPVSYQEGETIAGEDLRGEAIYFIEQGGCYVIVDHDDQE